METLKYYGMNKGTIYLQQDNDPKHKSKSTMLWLKQNKVRYINDWPPNSPDLNPIEHVWHLLKLRLSLYERKARNIDELWERVDVEWNKLDKDVCRSYIDSMPDRIAAVTLYRHGLDVCICDRFITTTISHIQKAFDPLRVTVIYAPAAYSERQAFLSNLIGHPSSGFDLAPHRRILLGDFNYILGIAALTLDYVPNSTGHRVNKVSTVLWSC
ncbi:hypothetical protein G6F41_013070 [Rhizopus arrhizus]|nr:hypothetical protein G6F41_013070 [Rhizopus arrhizus]